jgi:cytochrome P450
MEKREPSLVPGSGPDLPITHGKFLDFADDPGAWMRRLHQSHGEIAALQEQGQRIVVVFGPRYNHQVLSDTNAFHARFFALRGPRNSAQRRLTSGLLSMNGDEHKRHRRLVAGPFQKASIAKYQQALTDLAQGMVQDWKVGQVRDIQRDMNHYMLRVTSSLLFGFDLDELAYEIGRLTERWVRMNHEVGMGAFITDPRFTESYAKLLEHADALEAAIRKMIELRRTSAPGQDVLSLLIQARDEEGKGMTDAELIGQAAVLFGAAHLTTAHTLTWALFLLSQHPNVAADLVDELQGTLRGDTPTLAQLDQLPLLDRVVKEGMRVLPASAYSQRMTAETVQLGPFLLPAGVPIVFTPLITHRMPELFAEPERYKPERWETLTPAPYAYIPFAAGPRLCLGAALAMMTIKTTLPTILQRFRLSVVPGATIDARVISTMLTPTAGMPMLLSDLSAPFTAGDVNGNIHSLVDLSRRSPAAQPRAA